METTNQIKMTTALAILFAICSGLAIGNMYWAQPLFGANNDKFWIARS